MKKTFFFSIALVSTMLVSSLISCTNGSKENNPTVAEQAASAGYIIPDAPEKGVSAFDLSSGTSGSIISSNKASSVSAIKKYGEQSAAIRAAVSTTTEGAVIYTYTLSSDISGDVGIKIWRNGEYSALTPADIGVEGTGEIALQPGQNFVCIVVMVDGQVYGRSSVLLINSQVTASLYRFEMTWDNEGDVDLHLDTTDDLLHVCYSQKNQDINGYLAELDIDNTDGYGPENIRVFATPDSIATMRVFVDYYAAYVTENVNVTVRIYKDEVLVDTETIVLTNADQNTDSVYGAHSKVVDLLSIK